MRPIGFSTGALAYSDFRRGLEITRRGQCRTIELSALRENELAPLVEALDALDLCSYTYISVHAPSKFQQGHEADIVRLLRKVANKSWPIVLHPDVIQDASAWDSFGSLVLIENMDKRNNCGRTARELGEIFSKLPQAGLCFDIGHCRQVDPTMNESYLILKQFKNRLRQLHVSEVNSRSTHDPLSSTALAAFQKVASLVPEKTPVILESPVQEGDVEREIERARTALPIPAFTKQGNSQRVTLQGAIA